MPGRRNPLKRDENFEKNVQNFLGRWKVEATHFVKAGSNSDDEEVEPLEDHAAKLVADFAEDMKGVQFTLDEQYDITWHIPQGKRDISLFSTNGFDLTEEELELMGTTDGTSYVFEICPVDDGIVHLDCPVTPDVGLKIVLRKVNESSESSFSLLDAFEQGYFSDLNIRSKEGQQFAVHRSVLSVACPGIKYRDWEVLLSSLSTAALRAALNFVYTSSLPSDVTEDIAREILEMASKSGKMGYLKDLCSMHIEGQCLKKKLLELVDSVLHSLDTARQMVESTDMSDPAKTTYAIKQLAREAAIAISRLALLCQLYTSNKQKMTKIEKREVLEYVQARVVVCLDQGRELLQLILAKWDGLSIEQKREAAAYIIPEVERIWGILNTHATKLHEAIAKIAKKDKTISGGPPDLNWKATAALQFSTKLKDIKRLKKANKELDDFVRVGTDKRQWFMELTEEEKVDRILRVIQEMQQDGEELVSKFEEAKKKILLANALDWNSYKLAISISCSVVTWSINKLLNLRESIKPILKAACKYIGSEDVSTTLVYLSLLEPSDITTDESQTPDVTPLVGLKKHSLYQTNLLAEGCTKLLETQEMCDMHFVVIDPQTPSSIKMAHADSVHPLAKEPIDDSTVIKAHRVVLAARSEWFRRALQSGMIEDRDRRIAVQDIEESLFRTFLEYIYGKALNFNDMKIEELIELLAVADRYETLSLRHLCEGQLVSRVMDNNVFQLLAVAEQFSARKLREVTLNHILSNPNVVMTQVGAYSDLSVELKKEVRLILSGTQDTSHFSRARPPTLTEAARVGEPVLDLNRDVHSSSPDSQGSRDSHPGSESTNGLSIIESNSGMVTAIQQFRMVVGEIPTDEEIRALLLAADLDVNRAVNYFFGIEES